MIMRFRPANIRLINRRSKLLRLLLALSSGKESNDNDKTTPLLSRVDTVTPYQANALIELGSGYSVRRACMGSMEAALLAGRTAASVTMTVARSTAPARVRGSDAVTP